MFDNYVPFLEIFLGFLGFGLSILFCATFCRVCSRIRQEQMEVRRQSEQEDRRPPIFFIPFPTSMSRQDSEDQLRVPEFQSEPPRYSITAYCGPPPSYNELGCKPDDLPPAYTERDTPVYPFTPPPHTDMVQPQTQSEH